MKKYIRICPTCKDEKIMNAPPKERQLCMTCHVASRKRENDDIPEGHTCKLCGKDQTEVVFTRNTAGNVKTKCTVCIGLRITPSKRATADEKQAIVDGFTNYFKGKSYGQMCK